MSGTTASYALDTTKFSNGTHTLSVTVTDATVRSATASESINVSNGTSVVHGKQRKTFVIVTNTSASTRVVTVRRNAAVADPVPSDYSTAAIAATTAIKATGARGARRFPSKIPPATSADSARVDALDWCRPCRTSHARTSE